MGEMSRHAKQTKQSGKLKVSSSLEQETRRQKQRSDLFAEVTLKIRNSLQLEEILQTTVQEVQRILQADRVLIYQVLANGTGKAISEALVHPYPAVLGMTFPEEVFPRDYHKLYTQGRVRAIADVHAPESGLADCLVEFVAQFQIQAKLIVPIVQTVKPASGKKKKKPEQNLWGLLIAHQCEQPKRWVDFELELMEQLANQISIALSQAQLLENLEEVVQARTLQLQKTNQQLKQEIRDRKQAEAALRRNEEQLRLITNALPVLIAYVDHKQHYQFNNEVYHDWLNQPLDAIKGRHIKTVWGKQAYATMQPHIEQALRGETVNYDHEITVLQGQVRAISVTYIPHIVSPKNAPTKQVKGFFALTSDISDRKAIERMKDEFLSVVSHELRTPLTSLHSALKILSTGRLGTLSRDGQQMLEIADENTERLVRLVNDVLDLQRIESGAVIIEKQFCDTADIMTQAVESMRAMANHNQVSLELELISVPIWANPDYLLQALTNLLSNAIKFSAPGSSVILSAQYPYPLPPKGTQHLSQNTQGKSIPEASSKPYGASDVLFQVQDQGQGIPADKLNQIFERFQQVDSSDSRKKGGTGLGLTICRKIVEQHDGSIWVKSKVGQGSTFFVSIPVPHLDRLKQGSTSNDEV